MTDVLEQAPPPQSFPPPRRPGGFGRLASKTRAALTNDLPLKTLALVLAVLAWLVVREKIGTEVTVQDVDVQIVVPDQVVVLSPVEPKINVLLRGTWSEVARARSALSRGEKVVLRLAEHITSLRARGGREGITAPISNPQKFLFPFDDPGIAMVQGGLVVDWSIVETRTVALLPPAVLLPPDSRLEPSVTLEERSVRLIGPASLFVNNGLGAITPDAVDAAGWLKDSRGPPDLSTPMPFETRFERWREADPRLRNPRVLRMEPAVVKGKVKFKPIASQALERTLEWNTRSDVTWLDTYDYVIESSPEYDQTTNKLTLSLTGDPAVLDRLRASPPEEWGYYIVRPSPPEKDEEPQHFTVPVSLRLPPGVSASLEKSPTLFVTVRKKPSPGEKPGPGG